MDQDVKTTIQDFKSDNGLMKTLLDNFGSVLVFVFYADWNQASKQFLKNFTTSIPVFGQYDNVKYYSFAAERCPQIFQKFQVEKTPTVIFTQTDKKILHRYQGDDIGTVFDSLSTTAEEHKIQFQKDKAIWEIKVQNVIQSCPFIIFIKGTPANPKCGFTRTLLQILKDHQVQFTYVDIIEDENMRYWVRYFKKWPTYPQVFINGELIVGGLDKIKQLVQTGEFEKMIPESCKQGSPELRYNNILAEHKVVVFIDSFPFENKESAKIVEASKEKYGDKIAIYNVSIDSNLKKYVEQDLKQKLPFVIAEGKITKQ